MEQGRQTATGIALALDSAQLLMTPEKAVELAELRRQVESSRVDGRRLIRAEQRSAELEAVLGTHRDDDRAEIERLRARVTELESPVEADRAKAPWGRGEDGRPILPMGAHWTDIPELVDQTLADIQARVDQAQPGNWYVSPTAEAPDTVCTRYDGYTRTVGRFTNALPGDVGLVLHAHSDLRWCLDMIAKLQGRVAELEAQRERRRVRLVALQNDALSMRGSLSPNGEERKVPFPLGDTLTPAVDWLIARVAELEAEPTTVYRASHDAIVFGLYATAAPGREHCEVLVRREQATAELDWIEDEEDGVAELVATVDGIEWTTGYVVTALEVASAYDEEADE